MADNEQTNSNPGSESQEESPEELAALFRGEDIADEVDSPPPKRQAKAKVEAPVAEPDDEEPDDSDDDDESSPPGLAFLKKAASAKHEALEARLAELEEELSTLRPRAKRGEMTLRDMLDNDDSMELLSVEEKQELIQRVFAELYPDKATPEDKAEIARAKYAREQRKAQEALARKEEEMRKHQESLRLHDQVNTYRGEVREYLADNYEKFPAVLATYGDRKNVAAAVFSAAEFIARSGKAESDGDISPEVILKLMEEELSSERKKAQKSERPRRNKPVPVTEQLSGDDELEEMARIMRGA